MEPPKENGAELVRNSVLYKEFLAEREEILRHKWIESEKAGYDIGFERLSSIGSLNIDPRGESADNDKSKARRRNSLNPYL